jgi:hypothetical protein
MTAYEPAGDRSSDPTLNQSVDQPNESLTSIKKLGDFRDSLLVGITLLYVLGYLVWSIHAWENRLGLLPALEPQYLSAGIPVVIILWLSWLGYRLLKRLAIRIQDRLDRLSKRQKTMCTAGAFLCVIASNVLFRWAERYKLTTTVPAEQARLWMLKDDLFTSAAALLALIGLWLFGLTMFAKAFAHFYFILYLLLVIVLYVSFVHPHLPQEFGGERPRCAYVDVVRDQISEPLQKLILPQSTMPSKAAVQRSEQLQVFFSGSEFLLVKPAPQGANLGGRPSLVELKKSTIQAIEWCD